MTNTWNTETIANRRAEQLIGAKKFDGRGIDPLATMTPEQYRMVKRQLTREGLWHDDRA